MLVTAELRAATRALESVILGDSSHHHMSTGIAKGHVLNSTEFVQDPSLYARPGSRDNVKRVMSEGRVMICRSMREDRQALSLESGAAKEMFLYREWVRVRNSRATMSGRITAASKMQAIPLLQVLRYVADGSLSASLAVRCSSISRSVAREGALRRAELRAAITGPGRAAI